MAPATLYRRAIRRVDRRAATLRAVRPVGYTLAPIVVGLPIWSHCADCERAQVLLTQAVRTANRLAYAAGIAGELADDRRYAPR